MRSSFRRRVLGSVLGTAVLWIVASAPPLSAQIRFWVDSSGVTHFSDHAESGPADARSVEENGIETLRAVWGDGFEGPRLTGSDSSFGDDRVLRLLRGAQADLGRGEIARADSTLRGVLRLDPRRPEAHWYLASLARARGRITSAEHHLRLFLDGAGADLDPWRRRAKVRLAALMDERRLADPDQLDGPLEFDAVRDEHFRVEVDAEIGEVSHDYTTRVLGFLRAARTDVSRELGVSPLEPLGVVLYGRAAYVRAHAHRFSFQTVGFFDGRIHVASPAHPTDPLRGLLYHEYAHAVFREVTGGDRPYWLNEGLAERIERGARDLSVSTQSERAALRANVELDAWIPLSSIARSFSGLGDEQARNAYLQSVVTVDYLHARTDVAGRRRLLERLGEGFSVDQALHEMIGLDTQGLEEAVRQEIRHEFPEWSLPAASNRDS